MEIIKTRAHKVQENPHLKNKHLCMHPLYTLSERSCGKNSVKSGIEVEMNILLHLTSIFVDPD